MTDLIINNFDKIIGTIAVAVLGGYIKYRINRKNRTAQAASMFRSKVLSELVGLYPVTQHWDMNTFSCFPQTIIKIENAAAEFRFFVPDIRKSTFDAAVKEYCDYCRQLKWDKYVGWAMYETMREPGEINPRDQFARHVDSLLSFAKVL